MRTFASQPICNANRPGAMIQRRTHAGKNRCLLTGTSCLIRSISSVSGNRTNIRPCCAGNPASFSGIPDLMDDRDEWPDDADDEENISGYLIRRNSISASLWYSTSSKSFYRTNSITCGGYSSARAPTPVSRICCNERMLDRWHDFETKATEKALKEWCDVNDVAIDGRDREAPGPDHH